MSRANAGVSERSEFPDLQRILNFYPLKNLASNELFLLILFFLFFLLYQIFYTSAILFFNKLQF